MANSRQYLVVLLLVISPIAHGEFGTSLPAVKVDLSSPKLLQLVVNNQNVFDKPDRLLYRIINFTHWITRKEVISREVWLRPGERVTDADLRELERNLRDLNLFSEVSVELKRSASNPDVADLVISTKDKLSFLGVAGGTFLGGIGEVGFVLSETNLWGLGHQLQYRYVENTRSDSLGTLSYQNVLLAGDDIYTGFELGRTDSGQSASVKIENRFQHFNDSLSWKFELKRETDKQDYFEEGESVAQVPREDDKLVFEQQWHRGQRELSWRFGPVVSFERTVFDDVVGEQANTINRPEDVEKVFAGMLLARNRTWNHQRVTGLDTLGFTQDLALGYNVELLAGLNNTQTQVDESTLPVIFFNAANNNAVSEFNYLNVELESVIGVDKNRLDSWNVTTGVSWFNTRLNKQTVGAQLKYSGAFNRTGLPVQQSLGEDTGLRGYPANEFNGEQTLLLNVEHRFNTNLSHATIELGSVLFFDAAWIGDRGSSDWLNNAQTSAGFGLRFGSPQLLGSAIVRLDFAYPLEYLNGKTYTPTISIAIGQVFGF